MVSVFGFVLIALATAISGGSIVRQEPEYEWRSKGGKIFLPDLIGASGIERELRQVDENEEIAAQDLAEDLLEKLAEILGDEN